MTDRKESLVGWQEIAVAIPGGVGIQQGSSLAYASPTFTSIVGAKPNTLTGSHWRTFVESTETEQAIRDALSTARMDGLWTGKLRFNERDGGQQVEVTLSTIPDNDDSVLWILSRETAKRGEDGRSGTRREAQSVPTYVSPTLAWTVLDNIEDVVYVIDEDGEFSYWNHQLAETTGYSHDEIESMHPSAFIPQDQQEYVPGLMQAIEDIRDRRVEVDILTKDGERITHEFKGTTFEDAKTGQTYRCGIARNLSERLERKRRLELQRDELATLNRINNLLFETARELIQTGSRSAVEEAVCDRLGSSPLYDFVCVCERNLDGEGFVSRQASGFDGEVDTDLFDDWDETETSPIAEAARSGTVNVVSGERATIGAWASAADTPAVSSLAIVPLQRGETVYGALVVTTDRTAAFSPREQAGLEVFGKLMGAVIHAARSQELLFADTVIELEFDFTGSDSLFAAVATTLGCRLTLDGYVASQNGWVVYVTAERADPTAVVRELSEHERVFRARCISDDGNSSRIEVRVTGISLLQVVSDVGATVQQVSATPDIARFVVETPIKTDVRRFVDKIGDAFPAATLVATHKRDREITTAGRPGGILDTLTDRQREVLEAAYQAGYFAWPRESTAEEVAESLELTSATLHGHLRKAEQGILAELLDEV